jgi:hypothetical protein
VDGARRRFLPYAVAGDVGQRQFPRLPSTGFVESVCSQSRADW